MDSISSENELYYSLYQIITEYNCYKLVVNGILIGQFEHRAAFTDAKVLEITGDVKISSIQEHFSGGNNMGMGQAIPQVCFGFKSSSDLL